MEYPLFAEIGYTGGGSGVVGMFAAGAAEFVPGANHRRWASFAALAAGVFLTGFVIGMQIFNN